MQVSDAVVSTATREESRKSIGQGWLRRPRDDCLYLAIETGVDDVVSQEEGIDACCLQER